MANIIRVKWVSRMKERDLMYKIKSQSVLLYFLFKTPADVVWSCEKTASGALKLKPVKGEVLWMKMSLWVWIRQWIFSRWEFYYGAQWASSQGCVVDDMMMINESVLRQLLLLYAAISCSCSRSEVNQFTFIFIEHPRLIFSGTMEADKVHSKQRCININQFVISWRKELSWASFFFPFTLLRKTWSTWWRWSCNDETDLS